MDLDVSIITLKLIAIGILFVLALFGGYIAFHPKLREGYFMHLGEAFAVGVFLCVSIVHLLPDALNDYNEYFMDHKGVEDADDVFPLPFVLTIIGYMVGIKITLFLKWHDERFGDKSNVKQPVNIHVAYLIIFLFALSTPAGIGLGLGISTLQNGAITGCITGFAAGTFLFIHVESLTNVMSDKAHGHHGMSTDEKKNKAFLLLGLLTVHSTIEGLALGVQTEIGDTLVILIAIACHKAVETFALGIYISKSTRRTTIFEGYETICDVVAEIKVGGAHDTNDSARKSSYMEVEEDFTPSKTSRRSKQSELHKHAHNHDTPSIWASLAAVWTGIAMMAVVAIWA